jgi:KaiC/GvpD/RAD55 family RecA-like ATPase
MADISEKFLDELFLLCFYKKDIISAVDQHFGFEYIPKELRQYKKILKSIKSLWGASVDKLPSIGIVAQQHSKDLEVQDALKKIKKTKLPEKEHVLQELEKFIKLSKFELLNKQIVDCWKREEYDKAIKLQADESLLIHNFSIKKDTAYFSKVFGDFEERQGKRATRQVSGELFKSKIPFGIYPIDIATEGGIDRTDTVLWIMRSGVGKSTALRWTAMNACRLGFKVLHIQLEGSQEECEAKYDQLWTASLWSDINKGNINHKNYIKAQKTLNTFLTQGKDVHIHAFEQFNTASMIDVRNLIEDFTKIHGEIDLVVIDYLKYLMPGDGLKYGSDTQGVKMRKENTSDKIKNTAVEYGTRIITADQATGIAKEQWNSENYAMDRYNIAGAKNLPDSYSYVITGNQTEKEKELNTMRLYFDKLRNYNPSENIVKIITNYQYGRFYNHNKTIKEFYDSVA